MIYYCQLLCTAPKRVSFLHPYMKLVDSSYSSCFTASSVSTSCLHSGHVLCRSSQGTRQSLSNKWPLYPKRLNHLLQNIYTHNKYSITYHGILVTKLPLVRNTSLQIVQVSCLQYLISARCKVTAHRSIIRYSSISLWLILGSILMNRFDAGGGPLALLWDSSSSCDTRSSRNCS